MYARRSLALTIGFSLVLAGAIAALAAEKHKGKHEAKEETVTAEQVPQAARDALTKLAGTATIDKYEKEMKEGATLYEGEWKVDGREFGATVTTDGALAAQKEELAADSVPTAVKDAAAKALPNATGLKYVKKTFVMYKVEGKVGDKERGVYFFSTGQEHGMGHKHGEKCAKTGEKAK